MIDGSGTMTSHINNVCRSASFAIWNIRKIRNILDKTVIKELIHTFVTSRLDDCNSLVFGIPVNQVRKLQLLQNSAARFVFKTKKTDHITPALHELHWLPGALIRFERWGA